jgi:dTMP kinase
MKEILTTGVLIVFEGIDGTGKSTQLELLADALIEREFDVVTTREPTEGVFGQNIRQLYINRDNVTPEEELQLFIDDRREHVEKFITPSLKEKKIILCDRYYLSTVAYQGAMGFDPQEILRMNHFAPEPDLALIFQTAPATSIERITSGRGDTLNDFEQEDSLTKVAAVFDSLEFPYIKRIDATKSISSIHSTVVSEVNKILHAHQNR